MPTYCGRKLDDLVVLLTVYKDGWSHYIYVWDVWLLPEVSHDWMLSNVGKPTTLDYNFYSKFDQIRQNEHWGLKPCFYW